MTKFTVPSKDAMRKSLGQKRLSENVYLDLVSLVRVINEYDDPIAFEYANYLAFHYHEYSINPGESGSNLRHKHRCDKLWEWNTETVHHIVGRIPKTSTWLSAILEETGEEVVTSENMNMVQRACVDMANRRKQEYKNATGRELLERIVGSNSEIDPVDGSNTEDIKSLLTELIDLAIDILPERFESRGQGLLSSGGYANEEIVRRVLLQQGLEEGTRPELDTSSIDFTTRTDDADLIVSSRFGELLGVEVKSKNIRERAARARSDVLIGFFDNAAKIRSSVISGNEQTEPWTEIFEVAYVPPSKLTEINELDLSENDGYTVNSMLSNSGKLYLRPNTQFATDMEHFVITGEIPDR